MAVTRRGIVGCIFSTNEHSRHMTCRTMASSVPPDWHHCTASTPAAKIRCWLAIYWALGRPDQKAA